VVETNYGACLGCDSAMDLVMEMKTTTGTCCWMPASFSCSDQPFLACRRCGFQTDPESYDAFQKISSAYESSPTTIPVQIPACHTVFSYDEPETSLPCWERKDNKDDAPSETATTVGVTESHSDEYSSLSSSSSRSLSVSSDLFAKEEEGGSWRRGAPAVEHEAEQPEPQTEQQPPDKVAQPCRYCETSLTSRQWRLCPSCGTSIE
jgi:hypothetical protein